MIHKKVQLDDEDEKVFLEVYVADRLMGTNRNAVLVIPGGGYKHVCADREGEPIAFAFMAHGYNAFVLHYSVAGNSPKHFPSQLVEASKAIKHIRDHAEEYCIDPEEVFVAGFSAGGHLAGCLGTMWNMPEIYETVEMPYGYNKPTGLFLLYPVVTGTADYAQKTSFNNLLGKNDPSYRELEKCSLEKYVGAHAAPAFIIHTANDEIVSVKNSLLLANAYTDAKVPFELHIYPDGPHGMALGNRVTKCGVEKWENAAWAKWVENAVAWAETIL